MDFRTFIKTNISENEQYNTQANYDSDEINEIFNKAKPYIKDIFKYKTFFFLVKDGTYLAYIESYDGIKKGILNIIQGYSKERGAYKLLILGLLKKSKLIASDSLLSNSAIKFWTKLAKELPRQIVKIDVDDNVSIGTPKDILDVNLRIGIIKI